MTQAPLIYTLTLPAGADAETEAEGLNDALGLLLALSLDEGEREALGLKEAELLELGESEAEGESEADPPDSEAEGEREADGL